MFLFLRHPATTQERRAYDAEGLEVIRHRNRVRARVNTLPTLFDDLPRQGRGYEPREKRLRTESYRKARKLITRIKLDGGKTIDIQPKLARIF